MELEGKTLEDSCENGEGVAFSTSMFPSCSGKNHTKEWGLSWFIQLFRDSTHLEKMFHPPHSPQSSIVSKL